MADSSQLTIELNPESFRLANNNNSQSSPVVVDLKSINWEDEELPMPVLSLIKTPAVLKKLNEAPGRSLHTYVHSLSQVNGRILTLISNLHSPSLDNALYTHMVPRQIRIYLHTLVVRCCRSGGEWIEFTPQRRRFQLAKDGKRPLFIELVLNVPSNSECLVEMDYETAFLRTTDYPADASSGVHVPGPALSFEESNEGRRVSVHGESLLILLPVPDFSMPYNVICLVCTVIALFYGNTFTVTTKL